MLLDAAPDVVVVVRLGPILDVAEEDVGRALIVAAVGRPLALAVLLGGDVVAVNIVGHRRRRMIYARNDVTAKKYGESERSANRRDNEGAPYIFFGNVKYRPQPNYDDYIRRRIQQHTPASSTAKRRRAR